MTRVIIDYCNVILNMIPSNIIFIVHQSQHITSIIMKKKKLLCKTYWRYYDFFFFFNYTFGPQLMHFVSKGSLTLQMYHFGLCR
jgi:hypothetical protein